MQYLKMISDLALLWLWCRPAVIAPIRPLVWEPPYATGAALKKKSRSKNLAYHLIGPLSYPNKFQNMKPKGQRK